MWDIAPGISTRYFVKGKERKRKTTTWSLMKKVNYTEPPCWDMRLLFKMQACHVCAFTLMPVFPQRVTNALVINLMFKKDQKVHFWRLQHFVQSLPSKCDAMLDLLLLRDGIHGNALLKIDVMTNYLDFITVDVGGFTYVLSNLIVNKIGLF